MSELVVHGEHVDVGEVADRAEREFIDPRDACHSIRKAAVEHREWARELDRLAFALGAELARRRREAHRG